MTLIDRDALKKQMCKICNENYSDDPCEPNDCVFLNAIDSAPTIDAVPVVRCEKCLWYKPPHFRADDGTETPWDGTISLGMSDGRKGIYIGGKCKHERNTSYGETDKAFRKPYHFCSFGERRSDD